MPVDTHGRQRGSYGDTSRPMGRRFPPLRLDLEQDPGTLAPPCIDGFCQASVGGVRPDFSSTGTDARFSGSAVAHIVALRSVEKQKSSKRRVASVA